MNKTLSSLWCLVLLMSLAVSGMAAEKGKTSPVEMSAKGQAVTRPEKQFENHKISFIIKAKGENYAADVVVHNGTQSNYISVTTTTVQNVNGMGNPALKTVNVIANFLPCFDSQINQVDVQIQIEFSSKGDPVYGDVFMQVQTEVAVAKGTPIVLVSDPDKHIELIIDDLK